MKFSYQKDSLLEKYTKCSNHLTSINSLIHYIHIIIYIIKYQHHYNIKKFQLIEIFIQHLRL